MVSASFVHAGHHVPWSGDSGLERDFRKTKDQILDSVDYWCFRHPGQTRVLSGPGFRRSSHSARHYDTDGLIFAANRHMACTLGALANSVFVKDGVERANIVTNARPYPSARNLKDLQKRVKSIIGFVSLDKFREYDGSETKHFDVHWVLHSMKGVCLVRLSGYPGVDHLICADADRRKIYDSMETKPLKLSAEALSACCGESVWVEEIVECRKVNVYSSSSKWARRGLSASQKRKRLEARKCESNTRS